MNWTGSKRFRHPRVGARRSLKGHRQRTTEEIGRLLKPDRPDHFDIGRRLSADAALARGETRAGELSQNASPSEGSPLHGDAHCQQFARQRSLLGPRRKIDFVAMRATGLSGCGQQPIEAADVDADGESRGSHTKNAGQADSENVHQHHQPPTGEDSYLLRDHTESPSECCQPALVKSPAPVMSLERQPAEASTLSDVAIDQDQAADAIEQGLASWIPRRRADRKDARVPLHRVNLDDFNALLDWMNTSRERSAEYGSCRQIRTKAGSSQWPME